VNATQRMLRDVDQENAPPCEKENAPPCEMIMMIDDKDDMDDNVAFQNLYFDHYTCIFDLTKV